MRRSPFMPYAIIWLIFSVGGFFALRFYAPPFDDIWRALLALNVATFLLYGWDKAIAGTKIERVPERLLQLTAFLGSPVGALVAMNLFHHKTRKLSFQLGLAVVLLIQVLAVFFWIHFFGLT